MEIDALLEAVQDFEKKDKKEACSVLEQFLCHVAKTGQTVIPWPQFKGYFMFKLEKVMDDFHASTPEQKRQHNPNVDYVPFEQMKERILNIVDAYNGIPFTIQRLCELLLDPKRNYTGTDKFLMGLEKNVMVVSSVRPTSEKNGASGVNRMNGVMFPGTSSLYADSRNVNGPVLPKQLNRPKLSSCHLLSTNGFPDCPVSKEQVVEEHHNSDSVTSGGQIPPNTGIKNKHSEEEEDRGDSDGDAREVKRLKFDKEEVEETENEGKDSSWCERTDRLSETPDTSRDSRSQEYGSATSCDMPTVVEDQEPSRTRTEPSERDKDSSETCDSHSLETESGVDRPEEPAPSETSSSSDQERENSSSDELARPCEKQLPSSSSSPDLSTEGDTDEPDSPEPATETGEP
ncbi:serine/threonine-protein phosphatase 4 regulatory subunit 2-A-like [Brachionichthys hirsutus]|uniref:serine/threonine-protein phosphatase 4 regulatory subunit 2-A-like n=1 Tax=Brachionichthys hirsutus TaxID=412623 RepID=UPI003604576C